MENERWNVMSFRELHESLAHKTFVDEENPEIVTIS